MVQATVRVKRSGILKAPSERQTIVGDLRHAVVVDKCSGNNEHVEYLMTLTLHQHHHQYHHHHQLHYQTTSPTTRLYIKFSKISRRAVTMSRVIQPE